MKYFSEAELPINNERSHFARTFNQLDTAHHYYGFFNDEPEDYPQDMLGWGVNMLNAHAKVNNNKPLSNFNRDLQSLGVDLCFKSQSQ